METRRRIEELVEEKKKTTGKTKEKIAQEIGISLQTLIEYTSNDDDMPNIGAKNLLSLCNYFNCTPGYLLCTSNDPMKENTVKAIAQYTGLSDKAIENLHEYTKGNHPQIKSEKYKGETLRLKYATGKAILSTLLEQKDFFKAISAFAQSIAHEAGDNKAGYYESFFRFATRPNKALAKLAVRGEEQVSILAGAEFDCGDDPSIPTEKHIIDAAYELGYMCVSEKFYAKCCLQEGLDDIKSCVKKIQKKIEDEIQNKLKEWIDEPDPNIIEGGADHAQHQENDE